MTHLRHLLLFCLLLGRLGSQFARAQQVMPRLLSQVSKPPAINQTNDSMVEDERGRLWLATDNGIVCFDGRRFQVYHDPELKQGDSYYHVVLSPDGRIWCKPNGGNFLSYIDSRHPRPRIVRVPANSPLIQKYLAVVGYNYVFADADANLWIGQQGGLLKVDSRTFAVEPVFQESGQIVNWVTQDRQGVIWFATFRGVNAYNPRSRQLTRYERDPQHPATSLGYDRAFSVHALDNGTILVGLNNEIDVITPTTRTVRRLPLPRTTRFPLVPVHEFYNDGLGNAYFRTRLGVAYRYTARGEVERLEFGMPTQTVQLLCPGRGNRLWVDWQQSLAGYDLTQVRFVRRLELLEMEVNGTRLDESSLDPRLVHDTLGLPTLTIRDTDSLRLRVSPQAGVQTGLFRYRLAGHDRNGGGAARPGLASRPTAWQVTKGVDATVGYQPKAGTYTFELSQPSASGGWAKPVSTLTLVVKPPFWRTGWFWALVLAITGSVGGGLLQSWNRRRKLRQELARQAFEAATLRQMDEMKSRFFANITHEFRTPLTIILNATEQEGGAALSESEHKRWQSVRRNAHQLLRLVNETLDMAKLDAGKLDRREHIGDPVGFVEQVVAQFRGLADQKLVGLEWVGDSETGVPGPALYQFDDDKVEKITYNLLANALKFTPAGGLVRVEARITAGHRFALRVADTGIGIAPDQLARVFERFYQRSAVAVDNSSTRAYSGTGIGLALVKELTDWLGGTVAVESTVGTGSVFTVELPLTPCTTAEPPDAEAALHSPSLKAISTGTVSPDSVPGRQPVVAPSEDDNRPLVLVVEDNDELRTYVVDSLSTDYRVVTAENGRRGLERAIAEVPDLIVSDVMMPELDGYELVERLKADERTSHIPVVLLTAKSSYDSRMKGLGAGADDYVSKPFSLAELGLRIGNCLRTRQSWQRRLTTQSATADANPIPDPRLTKEAGFLNRLRQLILDHLADEAVDVDWLAAQANMSRTQLHRKLTALTNISTTRFIHSVRLEKAADLLQTGEFNVAQVAQAVGYNSQSYFTKIFQEHFGYLPHALKV